MSARVVRTVLVHAKDHKVGDGFLQAPFFRSLRSRFPDAHITLAVSIDGSAYASTLSGVVCRFVDEVMENVGLCLHKSQMFSWQPPLDGRRFDLVIDMQKTWWRTLAVRRVRHKLFISASRHFLFSDRWPSSFKACLSLSGCGLAAFPCRLSSGIVKIVPVVGHPAAAPLDACADFIDPG